MHGLDFASRVWSPPAAAFRTVREEWGLFSNFARQPLGIPLDDGRTLTATSSEALYQACKFTGHPAVQLAVLAASPADAKAITRDNAGLVRGDWA